jgi:hypothetical protein
MRRAKTKRMRCPPYLKLTSSWSGPVRPVCELKLITLPKCGSLPLQNQQQTDLAICMTRPPRSHVVTSSMSLSLVWDRWLCLCLCPSNPITDHSLAYCLPRFCLLLLMVVKWTRVSVQALPPRRLG